MAVCHGRLATAVAFIYGSLRKTLGPYRLRENITSVGSYVNAFHLTDILIGFLSKYLGVHYI